MKILNGITLTGNASINANSLIVGTNQLVATNGRIGVGTTSPSQLFSVGGNSDLNGIIIDGAKIYTPGADLKLISGGPQSDRNNIFLINNGGIIIDGGSSETAGVQIKGGGGNVRVTQGILQVDTGSALNTITSYFTTGNNDGGFRLGFANGSGASLNTEQGALVFTYGGTRIGSIGFNRGGSANCDAITFSTSTNNERMRITSAGRVGIGLTNPETILQALDSTKTSTTVGANVIARFQSNGSGADTCIQFSDGVANAVKFGMNNGNFIWLTDNTTERMRLTSSGSFGIGATTSVSGKLQIYEATSSGNTTEMLRFAWQDNNWGMKIDQIHTGSAIDYAFRIRNQGATYNELLYMKPTGRIGIGNISPAAELHITDSNPEILRLERTGGFGNAAIGVSSSGSMVFFGKPNIGNFAVGASFDLTSSPYLTIGSNGNVGIATGSTPSYKLDVKSGTASFEGTSGVEAIRVAGAAGSWFWIDNPTTTRLRFSSGATAGTNPMIFEDNGYLGLGVNPSDRLHIKGVQRIESSNAPTGNHAKLQLNATASVDYGLLIEHINNSVTDASIQIGGKDTVGNIGFATNTSGNAATTRMTITSTGNVGIGTAAPAAKLDVVGEVRTSSRFGYGASAYTQYNSTTKSIDFIFA